MELIFLGWNDNYLCKFPTNLYENRETTVSKPLTEYFLSLNAGRVHEYDAPVISYSHFYSRIEQF